MSRLINKLLSRRQVAKRLMSVGSQIDTSFMLYINNLDPISFPSYDDCFSYLKGFRENNEIFKLQIFRIETYSL